MIDRSREKRLLAELAAAEAEQVAAARERLATESPMRLSQIGVLDPGAFHLFLDLLGEALAVKVGSETAEATSSDGSLHVTLVPTGDGVTATIETSAGRLSGPDYFITIRALAAERRLLGEERPVEPPAMRAGGAARVLVSAEGVR